MHRIQNYDENVIKNYNESFNDIVENIRDFIFLHYLSKRNDTDFWKNILNIEMPKSLENNLKKWQTKLPIAEDFRNSSTYSMFRSANFINIMVGLNLFDNKLISQEYNFLANNLKNSADFIINDTIRFENTEKFITHKEMLKIIRDIN